MIFSRASLIPIIFLVFFSIFVFLSFKTMVEVPFYDFDEAHRAENAKRMKEYGSYFVPLTGSSQDRIEHLKIPFRQNPDYYLYYHLERPPLVYILMMISTSIFGNSEWAYRLASFVLGVSLFGVFLFFAKKEEGQNIFAISLGLLILFTSSDLWLSSQYAQMDTGISLFLTLSLLTLISYISFKKKFLIILSGMFFGLSLLSKLQPAVIFIFPLAYLFFSKKVKLGEIIQFTTGTLIIFLPWIIYLVFKFGILDVVNIMSGFAISSASIDDIHHKAPFFWYIRWWWEMLRPGWTLFSILVVYEILAGHLEWKKKTLLAYVFGGLLVFSIPTNKIWWYVLPLIPAIAYFVFLSVKDYLEEKPSSIINLSIILILASIPMFLKVSNTQVLIYGFFITLFGYLILIDKINLRIKFTSNRKITFYFALILSLIFFTLRFPEIIPYHRNTKGVSELYKSLPNPKCLWLGDMPGEAVLFYSEAGEVPLLTQDKGTQIFENCINNYLITPEKYKGGEQIYRVGNIRLYKL